MSRPGLVVSGRRVPRGLWWLSPAGAVLFVTLPTLWLATALEPSTYLNSWQTPKYLTTGTAALILIGALVFMATSGLMLLRAGRADETRPWPRLPEQTLNRLGRAAEVCFWITLVGYAAWGAVGLANGATPAVLLEALVSQNLLSGDIKDMFPTVPGITTLTQVGVAYVVVTMLILVHRPQRGSPGGWHCCSCWRCSAPTSSPNGWPCWNSRSQSSRSWRWRSRAAHDRASGSWCACCLSRSCPR